MTGPAITLRCAACGWEPAPPELDPYPFRCPNAGRDDGDHVMSVVAGSDPPPDREVVARDGASSNPFIRYRTSLYSWHVARSHGLPDGDYVAMVERTDEAIARVAGTGFRVTPFCRSDSLTAALGFDDAGGIWVKDETGNVAGSHKARHLIGVALYLEVLRQLRIDPAPDRPLAVASCGNAALAAAVVARAIGRQLLVFVPDHASPAIVAQLEQLGAAVRRCRRAATAVGDPSYLAFKDALAAGALPFSCQGNENGLAIEGAKTLAYEVVDGLSAQVKPKHRSRPATLDRVVIQVGGGALASAFVQGLADCLRDGRLSAMPVVHAVQTRGCYPLARAYDRLVDFTYARLARSHTRIRQAFASADERARYLAAAAGPALYDEVLACARHHRSQFMSPWETEPASIAGGILDDETYDWAADVEAMLRTGGFPLVVDEATLEESNVLAREATGMNVDHTGSSGLAGLVALTRSLGRPRADERVAVLFTGVRR